MRHEKGWRRGGGIWIAAEALSVRLRFFGCFCSRTSLLAFERCLDCGEEASCLMSDDMVEEDTSLRPIGTSWSSWPSSLELASEEDSDKFLDVSGRFIHFASLGKHGRSSR